MNLLNIKIPHLDRRTMLVGLALLALVLVGLKSGYDFYQGKVEALESNRNKLFLYQKQVANLPVIKKRIKGLERQAIQLEKLLFAADSIDGVTSAVQIRLQTMITDAGLDPESLRPLSSHRQKAAQAIQTITIKMRLSGTLAQFEQFLAQLYRSRQLFIIDSFTVKPYKKEGVKIFIDVKGLYRLQGDGDVGSGSSLARGKGGGS